MTEDAVAGALAGMPLFELFSPEQRAWVAARGEVRDEPAGTVLLREGTPPDWFWVLLEGELQISRLVAGTDVVVGTATEPGVWSGVVPYVFDEHRVTATALQDSRLLRLSHGDVMEMLDRGFPLAKHLMLGVTLGTERFQERVAERERLAALGRLSAGLAHELNNPAAAVARAADQLQLAVARHEAAALEVGRAVPDADLAEHLAGLRAEVAVATEGAPTLSTVERADREDELGQWLEAAGLDDGYDVAGTLVDAGLDAAALERLVPEDRDAARLPLLRWLVASTESAGLLRELAGATTRISDLVAAVKRYSYMDRAEVQDVDVSRGIEDTLALLRGKLGGTVVERDYAPDAPTITGRGGELNQVWTNLLDNAADALGGSGRIRIAVAPDGDGVSVGITDDGPGIPEDVLPRIFEPFFTTKGVGKGTGLGLDIAYRIVTRSAGGRLSVRSRPGETTFTVTLPRRAPGTG